MTVLALRLAAPLQSWGAASRFARRSTEPAPTKSGVLGLIAAAQGRRRTDPVEDLLQLRMGVRIDQPGTLVRDFQTARPATGKPLPLTARYYLGDAAFLVFLEAADELLAAVDEALRSPTFPLYLGRRSCPPAGPVSLGLRSGSIEASFESEPWRASDWYRRKLPTRDVRLATVIDCEPTLVGGETLRDQPVSFNPDQREYGWRSVLRGHITIVNPQQAAALIHDPFLALGGESVSQ